MVLVLVGYDQEQHHSFRDFDDCEELRYLTLLVPLNFHNFLYRCTIFNLKPSLQSLECKISPCKISGLNQELVKGGNRKIFVWLD